MFGKEWWLRLCLKSVERAGAAIIKLMQVRRKVEFVGVSFHEESVELTSRLWCHANSGHHLDPTSLVRLLVISVL